MDVLTHKSSKKYDYISRYSNSYTYYNTEDLKFVYGLTRLLDNTTAYIVHRLGTLDTLDSLANKYYGRPDLFWIIADFNRIQDPFINLLDNYTEIKIPTFSELRYKES